MKGIDFKQYKEKVASDASKNFERFFGKRFQGIFGGLFEKNCKKDTSSEIEKDGSTWKWLSRSSHSNFQAKDEQEEQEYTDSEKADNEQRNLTNNLRRPNSETRSETDLCTSRREHRSHENDLTIDNRSRQARWRERQEKNRFAFAYCLSLAANVGEALNGNDHFWKIQELLDPLQQDIVRRTILTHEGRAKLMSNKEMRKVLTIAPGKNRRAFCLYVGTAIAHLRSLEEDERLFILKLERKAKRKVALRRLKEMEGKEVAQSEKAKEEKKANGDEKAKEGTKVEEDEERLK